MLVLKIFAYVGFAFSLFAGMYWGSKVFTRVLEYLSDIIRWILPKLPRTAFVIVFWFILVKINFIPWKMEEIPVWEGILGATAIAATLLAFGWDLKNMFRKNQKEKPTS